MNAQGFYKRTGDDLLYAPTGVYGPKFTLLRSGDAADGWAWHDDEYRARAANRLPLPSAEVRDLCAAEGITDEATIERIARIVTQKTALRTVADAEEVVR